MKYIKTSQTFFNISKQNRTTLIMSA